MGPSIEELKASATSRAESMNYHSSDSLIQSSATGFNLNLPKDSLKPQINFGGNKSFADSRVFPTSSVTCSTIPSIPPQETLRMAAQTINGLIQKDKIQTDLGEFLNGNYIII